MSILSALKNWWNECRMQEAESPYGGYDPQPGDQATSRELVLPDWNSPPPKKKRGRPRKNEVRNAEIANRILNGESCVAIGKRFKLTPQSVSLIGKKYGARPKIGRRPVSREKIIKEVVSHRNANIIRAFEAGQNPKAIASDYDMTAGEVLGIIGTELTKK